MTVISVLFKAAPGATTSVLTGVISSEAGPIWQVKWAVNGNLLFTQHTLSLTDQTLVQAGCNL